MGDIEKLVVEICDEFSLFTVDARQVGNKAAARRARKLSIKITKDLKRFRKLSIK